MAKVVLQVDDEGIVPGADIKSGVTINEGDLVGLDSNGQLTLAVSGTGFGSSGILARGIVMTGGTIGQFGGTKVLTRLAYYDEAIVTGFSSLTPGGTCFTSTSSAGGIQQGEPSGTGKFRQCVGYAIDATTVHFDVDPTFTTL